MLEQGNVILLDEPTNHLDLPANEMLDQALVEYEGTLLVISHDRYLLNKFPHKILEMDEDGFRVYSGRYEDYIEAKEKEKQKQAGLTPQPKAVEEPAPAESKNGYRSKEQRQRAAWRRKRLGAVEAEISQLEQEKEELETQLQDPKVASDYQVLEQCTQELDQVSSQLTSLVSEWVLLGEEGND